MTLHRDLITVVTLSAFFLAMVMGILQITKYCDQWYFPYDDVIWSRSSIRYYCSKLWYK